MESGNFSQYTTEDTPRFQAFSISGKPETILLKENQEQDQNGISKSSNIQASFTLFKVFVGSGILALPASFGHVGFILGSAGIIFAGILTYYCVYLLLKVIHDMKANSNITLQDLTEKIIGRWGYLSVEISLVIMQVGVGIAIMIFATQFLNHLTCTFNLSALCDNKLFVASFALAVVAPLSFIENLHYFYIPSMMATFFVFLNVIVQIVYNFDLMANQDSGIVWQQMEKFNIIKFPLFFGVATYAFEGIGVIFSVRSSMQKPQYFSHVLKIQMIIVAFLYTFFPGTSELAFGDDAPEIILFSLPSTNYFYLFIQVLYVISALLGYPVQLFPVFKIIESSSRYKKMCLDNQDSAKPKIYKALIRMGIVLFMLFIALVAKSFNLFINLMGSGVFIYLGYLLPIIVYQTYYKGRVPKLNFVINAVSFVIGAVLGIIGIVVSLEAIINYDDN